MPVVTLSSTNTKMLDTYVQENAPTTPSGAGLTISLGTTAALKKLHGLLLFDLGLIPNDAIINSAVLKLYKAAGSATTIDIHALLNSWDESVTWNTRPSFEAASSKSFITGTENQLYNVDITGLLQRIVNGQVLNGFLFKLQNENVAGVGVDFTSREGTAANRPELTIDYTIPTTGKKQVEYVGSTPFNQTTSVTSVTPSLPTGWQAGDLLIAQIVHGQSGDIVPPSGWTEIQDVLASSLKFGLFYKFAQAGEPAPTFTSSLSTVWQGATIAFRNVKQVREMLHTIYSSNATAYSPPATTTVSDKSMLLVFNAKYPNSAVTHPLSFSEAYDNANATIQTVSQMSYRYMHDKKSTATSETTSTMATAGTGISQAVYLEPITNNPPTPPSGVTVDKSAYTVGDTITVNFTGSTDPEGDAITYEVDVYDGVSQWLTIATGKAASPITATVPSMVDTTAAKVRVRAVDSKGASSNGGQSGTFSVSQKDGQILAPVNVVSSAYLVSRMAPPVRLSNGWFVGALMDSGGYIRFYKSQDNGRTWVQLGTKAYANITNISLSSKGTRLYALASGNIATNLSLYTFDALDANGGDLASVTSYAGKIVDSSQTAFGANDLAITPDGTKLWWTASTKNSTYANSYNIRAGSIPINGDGTLGTPSAVSQVTTNSGTNQDWKNPCVIIKQDGFPIIVADYNVGTANNLITAFVSTNGTTFTQSNIFISNGYPQSSPMAIRTPNGKLHVVWHGTDSVDTTNAYIRYSNATTGADWLATPKKLVKGTNATITSDKNGKLTITYEDGGYIKRIESTDEFATYTAPITVGVGTMPASLYDPTFQFDFVIPPTFFQGASSVKYYGSFDTNKAPTLTLTSPTNNEILTDGENFTLSGSALETDVNNVVSLKYKINNNPEQTFDSYVSDGVSPRTFNKPLLYANQRITDAGADVSGVLEEGTTHTLSVWSEDNKGGKSPVVTRNFTVIANRAPVISGSNADLGELSTKPAQTYSAADPENNTFTITEMIDGVITRTFPGVANQEETFQITDDQWIRLDLDVPHELRIRATDQHGAFSDRIYTFVRTETEIVFSLDYSKQSVIDFFTTDEAAGRILFAMDYTLPEGATITVEACNNAYDVSPTWEDITTQFMLGRGYIFTNTTKTAAQWGVNFRVTANKGTATERVIIGKFRGAFD